jgi:hypothetical protein
MLLGPRVNPPIHQNFEKMLLSATFSKEFFKNLVTQGLLTQDQIDTILKVINKGSVADLCAALQNGSVSMTDLTNVVDKVVENTTTSAKLLACIGEKGEG